MASIPEREVAAVVEPLRAPLLILVLPLMAGSTLVLVPGLALPDPAVAILAVAALGAGIAAVASGWRDARTGVAEGPSGWNLFWLAGGALCAGLALTASRLDRPPVAYAGGELPRREAVLVVEVERGFPVGPWAGQRGLGRVVDSPGHLADLRGVRLFYGVEAQEPAGESTALPEPWLPGVRVVIRGRLGPVDADGSFGRYLRQQGILLELSTGRLEGDPSNPPPWIRFWNDRKARFEAILLKGAPEGFGPAHLLPAMVLGDKALIQPDRKELFTITGTLHYFAISGLHVGIVAGMLAFAFRLMRLPRWTEAAGVWLLLLAYVQVVGAPSSAVRAFLMISAYLGARLFLRRGVVFPALITAAWLVLLWNPRELLSAGFQLSYAAVLGILILGVPLAQGLGVALIPSGTRPRFGPAGSWRYAFGEAGRQLVLRTVQLPAIGLAASLATMPFVAGYFGVAAPGGILLSLLMLPLVMLAMLGAALSLLCAACGFEAGSIFFNHGAWMALAGMEWLVEAAQRLPLFWETVYRHPGGIWLLGFGMLGLFLVSRWILLPGVRVRATEVSPGPDEALDDFPEGDSLGRRQRFRLAAAVLLVTGGGLLGLVLLTDGV